MDVVLQRVDAVKTRSRVKLCPQGKSGQTMKVDGRTKWTSGWSFLLTNVRYGNPA
jgi:hypothetical protein